MSKFYFIFSNRISVRKWARISKALVIVLEQLVNCPSVRLPRLIMFCQLRTNYFNREIFAYGWRLNTAFSEPSVVYGDGE